MLADGKVVGRICQDRSGFRCIRRKSLARVAQLSRSPTQRNAAVGPPAVLVAEPLKLIKPLQHPGRSRISRHSSRCIIECHRH